MMKYHLFEVKIDLYWGFSIIFTETDFRPKFWPKLNSFLTIWIKLCGGINSYRSMALIILQNFKCLTPFLHILSGFSQNLLCRWFLCWFIVYLLAEFLNHLLRNLSVTQLGEVVRFCDEYSENSASKQKNELPENE